MIERHSKVFVPVSASEKYPDDASDDYFILDSVEDKAVVSGRELNYNRVAKVTHWLEEKENVYVLSEQELKEEKKKEAIAFGYMLRSDEYKHDQRSTAELYKIFNQQK